MQRTVVAALAAAALAASLACQGSEARAGSAALSQGAIDSVEALDSAFTAAMNHHDTAAAAAQYADDAVVMPPGMPRAVGHDAIAKLFASLGDSTVQMQLVGDEVHGTGDVAFRTGTYTVSTQSNVVEQGRYLTVFQRQHNGSWKITHDMWNSEAPPPSRPAAGATP
jgi:ketosteroid isomerase-like protein